MVAAAAAVRGSRHRSALLCAGVNASIDHLVLDIVVANEAPPAIDGSCSRPQQRTVTVPGGLTGRGGSCHFFVSSASETIETTSSMVSNHNGSARLPLPLTCSVKNRAEQAHHCQSTTTNTRHVDGFCTDCAEHPPVLGVSFGKTLHSSSVLHTPRTLRELCKRKRFCRVYKFVRT